MREIKFRVWDKHEKTMHGVYHFYNIVMSPCWSRVMQFGDSEAINDIDVNGEDDERTIEDIMLMQYTGLKDKNGKEIYEGDIAKITGRYMDVPTAEPLQEILVTDIGVMCFNQLDAQFAFKVEDSFFDTKFGHIQCEVIGNIYENPELIK